MEVKNTEFVPLLLSSSTFAKRKGTTLESIRSALAENEHVRIADESTAALSSEQSTKLMSACTGESTLSSVTKSFFGTHPISALLLSAKSDEFHAEITRVLDANKVAKSDYILGTGASEYWLCQVRRLLFPRQVSSLFETTVAVCRPALGFDSLKQVTADLAAGGLLLTHAQNASLLEARTKGLSALFSEHSDAGSCTVLVIEGIAAVSEVTLRIGTAICKEDCWQLHAALGQSQWFAAHSAESAEQLIRQVFGSTLPRERTIVLLKAMSGDRKQSVYRTLEHFRFSIVAKKSCELPQSALEHYCQRMGKAEGSEVPGERTALILERTGAIRSLQAVVCHLMEGFSLECASSRSKYEKYLSFWFPEFKGAFSSQPLASASDLWKQQLVSGESVRELIARGLTQVARLRPSSKPDEVTQWFAQWLIENNPNNATVVEQ